MQTWKTNVGRPFRAAAGLWPGLKLGQKVGRPEGRLPGRSPAPQRTRITQLAIQLDLFLDHLAQPRLWRAAFLVGLMTAAGLGQNAADLESPTVLRVAGKLKCSCGCNQNMACQMPGGCAICKTNRTKIFQMQQGGMTDQQILASYVTEKGQDILVIPPGIAGALGPYVALSLGFGVVLWTIRRYRHKRPSLAGAGAAAGPPVDPAVMAQIEKDMANLD